MKTFDQHVKEIKDIGKILVDFNFPKSPIELEEFIGVLKEREINFDGYSLIFNFNRSEYDKFSLEMLQIKGKYFPYLPFNLVCKICRNFFKEDLEYITYTEFYKNDKKVYCWASWNDPDGNQILPTNREKLEKNSFEGFQYYKLTADEIKFR